ncbi:efflux RND transporter permease subunit [Patescibacteria group bacterium]|nr:efflux RND transporter permease subunit [Patescibacteria group bacterium]
MLNKIISFSLKHQWRVVAVFIAISGLGVWSFLTMKVDVLPDINKPTVAVFTEAEGLAPEEVERLVLAPVENAVAGAPGVTRVRGTASFGLAIVQAEFDWGSDIYRNRQIIQERISRLDLPENVRPVLGPVSSIMGEIMWVGLTSEESTLDGKELRTLADWTVRPALLRVPGVSDIIVLGGDVKEWQVNLNPEAMRRYDLTIADVEEKLSSVLTNKSGGLLVQGGKEYPLRILVAPQDITEIEEVGITIWNGRGIRLADIGTVVAGVSPVRGGATIDGKPGVILRIAKQPEAETLAVTAAVDEALESIRQSLPTGVTLKNDLFRQEWFIDAGLNNVYRALLEGIVVVAIILALFLMHRRVTFITLISIPLSIVVTAIVFKLLGFSVNVMTLGGIAVAVGELVDNAIVGVENVFRRLREWKASGSIEPVHTVVFEGTREVLNSIVIATVLVMIVFLPVFFIPGVEGRLLASLGSAYLIALLSSLVVSVTIIPVLCALLLSPKHLTGHESDTKFVRFVKTKMTPAIMWGIEHVKPLMIATVVGIVITVGMYVFAGKEGIPPFNEGSATISVILPVGTDLGTSNAFASRVEKEIGKIEGVVRVGHITGRAGADPHDSGANTSEIQVTFEQGLEGERERLFAEIQKVVERFPAADFSIGQPITHRVEELLSGIRAPIVIKIYGDDLSGLKQTAERIRTELAKQEGVKNPQVQKEVLLPELRIYPDRNRLADYGLSSGQVAEELEEGLLGVRIGQVQEGSARTAVVLRYDPSWRGNSDGIRDLSLPFENVEALGNAAELRLDAGRNKFSHEGGKRVLVVSANYDRGNIVGAVEAVKQTMDREKLPSGQSISYEGTYKSQKENSQRLGILFAVGLILILWVLYQTFKSIPIALQIMLNIPSAIFGGMVAVWLTGGEINLAHLVGFISLAGIVSRNGIILISHTLDLVGKENGNGISKEVVLRATLDRVVPVLMTSLVTALALVPLLIGAEEPGKELLHPLAVVIFGGLISSTIVSLIFTPSVFYHFRHHDMPKLEKWLKSAQKIADQ